MENDYYEVSPVISVSSPTVKLSLPDRYSPRLMLTRVASLLFGAHSMCRICPCLVLIQSALQSC